MRRAVLAIASASVLAASACGGSGGGSSAPKGAQTVKITLSDAGCAPAKMTGKAGVFHFEVSNSGSSKVTELEVVNGENLILGERENIVPGVSGAFSLTLQPGTYTLACTNGDTTPKAVLRVTGHRVAAPGGPTAAHDPVDLSARLPNGDPEIPLDAHIRLASHATNGGMRILRRGYNYTDGIDPATGELDAGLFFICFQRDPHAQFAALQRRLGAGDALNEYIKPTSSAVFAIPAGVPPNGYVAQRLFA